jgi:uncharacterized membrane protein
MSVAWETLTVVMGLVFVFGAIVQYNDPDPYFWTVVYLAAAILSFVSLRRALSWWLPAGVAGAAIVWAGALAVRVDPEVYRGMFGQLGMASLEIEEARETLGLVIIAIWMTALAVIRIRRRP